MQGLLLYMAIYYEIQARKELSKTMLHGQPGSHLYANGFDDDTPGRFTSHPEHYANNQEQLAGIVDRQESDAAHETTPLLKSGGIGNSGSN